MAPIDISETCKIMMSPLFEYASHAPSDQTLKFVNQFKLVVDSALKETLQNIENERKRKRGVTLDSSGSCSEVNTKNNYAPTAAYTTGKGEPENDLKTHKRKMGGKTV